MTFQIGSSKNPNAAKAAAIAAARAKAAPVASDGAIQKWISPAEAKERIRIIFDDSGSMSSQIQNAKDGVVEFFRNCIPNQTAVAVHMLCVSNEKLENLNSNLIEAASVLKDAKVGLGGTPLYQKMAQAIALAPKLTRMVVFTDGAPTDQMLPLNTYVEGETTLDRLLKNADVVIEKAREASISIDTVFFGQEKYHEDEITFLKYLASKTGGFFLHFDPAKVNFRTAFKYLAPVNRLMLTSESVRREIESGQRS